MIMEKRNLWLKSNNNVSTGKTRFRKIIFIDIYFFFCLNTNRKKYGKSEGTKGEG
jgi:hypothetical protein